MSDLPRPWRARSATRRVWSGRGWRAQAWVGGAIATWPELVALRVRTAKAVYPWWVGPSALGVPTLAAIKYCPPCGEAGARACASGGSFVRARRAPSVGATALGLGPAGTAGGKPAGRSAVPSVVMACCPPGKHIHTPDAVFLERKLSFVHEASGLALHFDPEDAVRGCVFDAAGDDLAPKDMMPPHVQSQYAERWRSINLIKKEIDWAYDWTYSTRWWGCPVLDGVELEGVEDPDGALPMALLVARDEILWYEELEQYYDDLHDEGTVAFTVRARVMPGFFFVLARLELRVLNVVARQIDTRWLHVYGSGELVREWSWRERPMSELRRRARPGEAVGPELLVPMDTQRRAFHRFRMPEAQARSNTHTHTK